MEFIKFLIPILFTGVLAVWTYFQNRKITRLQKALDRKNLVHKYQFEKEFKIYEELWSHLVELRNHTYALRPIMDQMDTDKTWDEVKIKRLKKAEEIHNRLMPLFEGIFIETNPIPIKAGLAMKGLIKESYRLPMCEMQPENKEKLKKLLEDLSEICNNNHLLVTISITFLFFKLCSFPITFFVFRSIALIKLLPISV